MFRIKRPLHGCSSEQPGIASINVAKLMIIDSCYSYRKNCGKIQRMSFKSAQIFKRLMARARKTDLQRVICSESD